MNDQSFSLKPFPPNNPLPHLNITGNIARRSNIFAISYTLLGPLAELVIPVSADIPVRKNSLWEDTCFEFFISIKNSDRYWEFNLSPSGHWNVYRFKAYRQEMQEELAFTSLPFSVQNQSDALQLALELNLDAIVPAEKTLKVGICTVIKLIDGKVTYWALTHPGPQADFHRRDSFIVEL
jgi:hypothetical protein